MANPCNLEFNLFLLGWSGEMMSGPKRVLFMDEISTGLDSSTTYSITKWLRDLAHYQDYTILVSLLQPAPETYDLFDDIMLLANGKVSFLCFSPLPSFPFVLSSLTSFL